MHRRGDAGGGELVVDCRVDRVRRLVGREPLVDDLLVGHPDPLLAVAQEEAVEAHHRREEDTVVLRDLVELEGHVEDLLVALGEVD